MRISDWSSDVCSSDLGGALRSALATAAKMVPMALSNTNMILVAKLGSSSVTRDRGPDPTILAAALDNALRAQELRSEERRDGKECVSTCRYRGSTSL